MSRCDSAVTYALAAYVLVGLGAGLGMGLHMGFYFPLWGLSLWMLHRFVHTMIAIDEEVPDAG